MNLFFLFSSPRTSPEPTEMPSYSNSHPSPYFSKCGTWTPPSTRENEWSGGGEGRIGATKGWISADRGSKATLPLTIPRRVFKSSAKDSARHTVEIVLHGGRRDSSVPTAWPTTRALGDHRPLLRVGKRAAGACVASSPDSDLEAFSHNPTHGSFAPLAFQPSAMTNCVNQRFLSY